MVFFTDRDLGGRIFPDILRAAGIAAERHGDHFAADALDQDWIPVVAQRGWFILTHDQRIRYRSLEREAVIRSGAGLFVLIGTAPVAELGHNFVNTIARIQAFNAAHSRPFIAKVYRPSPVEEEANGRPGRVERWV